MLLNHLHLSCRNVRSRGGQRVERNRDRPKQRRLIDGMQHWLIVQKIHLTNDGDKSLCFQSVVN